MATGLAAATVAAADAAGRERFLPLRLCSLPLARWLNRKLFLEEKESGILINVVNDLFTKRNHLERRWGNTSS